ncbi:MAG: HAMP domain-containing protein [Bryobacterales bacterium]|nr:HAMP domain-containing protein [Bryobacterales bacterium]
MSKRLRYTIGAILLALSITLVVWQGSFDFGSYGPANPTQTFIFWALSTLTFLLMVTLGFMLFRTGIKLYIERRSNQQGSRIKSKIVFVALALSILPVFFLVLFSVNVLNRNLDKWFGRPAEMEYRSYVQMAESLKAEVAAKGRVQAALLAAQEPVQALLAEGVPASGFLNRFCREQRLVAASIQTGPEAPPLARCGSSSALQYPGSHTIVVEVPVAVQGRTAGLIRVVPEIPVDIERQQREVENYTRLYHELAAYRKNFRTFYLWVMALITVFVLFFATWIALFLAKQISGPVSALVHAAGEVRKGNLKHRVEVQAIDELGGLVRNFNEMTADLEASRSELEERRRFMEAILESIPTGVISTGPEGAIQRVNRALKQIFPQAATARALHLDDLFSREDTLEILYLMKRARRTGIATRQLELKRDARTLHLSVTVSALEEKMTSGFVIVLEDTSELLRAQKAAAWHEVARRVAHEIKNPLTPIALSAERISRQIARLSAPADTTRILAECSEIITREVESVKTLVNAFSQFARFPAAQPVRASLNQVVESAIAVFAGRLDGIEIRTELEPGLPPVMVDPEQFKRVVINLVDNSAEAMQDSLVRRIFISTQPGPADTIELVIADTGCGVSAEEKEKLFLPYFSTKGRGTGLGLAIVNHILSEHGANIRVEDNKPAGARFIIEVPVLVEEAVAQA